MKRKTPTAVTSIVLTLITVVFWAGFEVYRSLTIKIVPTVPAPIIEPLDPTLDKATLDGLNQRLFLQDSDIGNTQTKIVTVAPSPTVSPTGSPVASPSATPNASPTASP